MAHFPGQTVIYFWFNYNRDEKEETLLDVLLIHLNVNPGDKEKIGNQLATLKTLFAPKKKKGWF